MDIGVARDLLLANYDAYGELAIEYWFKQVWERLAQYGFKFHLDYYTFKAQRVRDRPIMVTVMADESLS